MRRIESAARSPVYSHFDETVTGVSSIRSYRKVSEFCEKLETLVDGNQRPAYMLLIYQK